MTATAHCPLVEVSGPPAERGRQYGEIARDRIRTGIELYSGKLREANLGAAEITELAEGFAPIVSAFDPAHSEEMRGIADGAGVTFGDVMLLNARTELLKLAERRGNRTPDEPSDGCTGVLALPEATLHGEVLHATNWDWKAECAETTVVLKVVRDDGPDILTFTEAGALARTGLNSAGISITANYLESDRDYRKLSVPLPLIRRRVLEQRYLSHAMHAVYVTEKSCSNNMMVAQADGVGLDFECAPDETFLVRPEGGLIVHANHFLSTAALSKLKDTGVRNMPDSLYRDTRVRELLEPHKGRLTRQIIVDALYDDWQSPHSVMRPPRPNQASVLTATVSTVVMEPGMGLMSVAMLPALGGAFEDHRLTPDDAAGRPYAVAARA